MKLRGEGIEFYRYDEGFETVEINLYIVCAKCHGQKWFEYLKCRNPLFIFLQKMQYISANVQYIYSL
jgi:hypothetical protein